MKERSTNDVWVLSECLLNVLRVHPYCTLSVNKLTSNTLYIVQVFFPSSERNGTYCTSSQFPRRREKKSAIPHTTPHAHWQISQCIALGLMSTHRLKCRRWYFVFCPLCNKIQSLLEHLNQLGPGVDPALTDLQLLALSFVEERFWAFELFQMRCQEQQSPRKSSP